MFGKFLGEIRGNSRNFPGSFREISGKCPDKYRKCLEMSGKFPGIFPGKFLENYGNFPVNFREMSRKFPLFFVFWGWGGPGRRPNPPPQGRTDGTGRTGHHAFLLFFVVAEFFNDEFLGIPKKSFEFLGIPKDS